MPKLEFNCETLEEARIYLNANNYLSLLLDLHTALHIAKKNGTAEDILKVVDTFYPEIVAAIDHSEGAY